ncbi:MAG: heavy-metal-associated domain-containing protein [Anaerolineales bacterium]|jgi:copper chaperone CopZ
MMTSSLDKFSLEVPALYGDHHVVEVRRILLALPGVADVYASSAFRMVEVTFDPDQLAPDAIIDALGKVGYLEEISWPEETGKPTYNVEGADSPFFRHTVAYEQTKQSVNFNQVVPYSGRPLWTCPGMGVIKTMEE